MSLREAVVPYLDSDGLVALQPTFAGQTGASGNGLLYTSLYFIALCLGESIDYRDRDAFERIVRSCYHPDQPGVLMRSPYPHQLEQNSHDDYTGVLAAAALMGIVNLPLEILGHGRRWTWYLCFPFRYVYNNRVPHSLRGTDGKLNSRALFLRFGALVAQMHWAAMRRPPLWARLAFAVSMLLPRAPHDQDAWIMPWLQIRSYRWDSFICTWAVQNFERRLEREGGIQKYIRIATRHPHRPDLPDHPISQAWA